eukprot:m.187750 g.187750  ORF g.187750 m.187750 type:complete len:51 (+) comp10550_c0_seq2:197-349(+)
MAHRAQRYESEHGTSAAAALGSKDICDEGRTIWQTMARRSNQSTIRFGVT